jgi:cell division transport system permease protein
LNRHGLREVARQIRESGAAGVVTVLLVAVATAWGGTLWNLKGWVTRELLARGGVTHIVAVARGPIEAAHLADAFHERFPSIAATLLKPADLRSELSRSFPELATVLQTLDEHSFPPLVKVQVRPSESDLVLGWLRDRPEITVVESSQQWQARLERTVKRVTAAGVVLASSLLAGCGVLVLLVVRLLVLEHADEIAVMRLIGAHEREIRLPYLVSGSFLGALGGGCGALLLVVMDQMLSAGFPAFSSSSYLLVILVVSGAVAGGCGAALGLGTLRDEL